MHAECELLRVWYEAQQTGAPAGALRDVPIEVWRPAWHPWQDPALSLTATAATASLTVGQTAEWTIALSNDVGAGVAHVTSLAISGLGQGASGWAHSPSAGLACALAGATLACTGPGGQPLDLAPGASAAVAISGTVTAPGQLSITATVAANQQPITVTGTISVQASRLRNESCVEQHGPG